MTPANIAVETSLKAFFCLLQQKIKCQFYGLTQKSVQKKKAVSGGGGGDGETSQR